MQKTKASESKIAKDQEIGMLENPKSTTDPTLQSTDKSRYAKEIGGRDGPDPTRYGDWEKNGRCIDF